MKIQYIFAVLFLAFATTLTINHDTSAAGCDDVHFVFARGSGSKLGDKDEQAWREAIETKIYKTKLKYKFYELGTEKQGVYQYPAVAISGSLSAIGNLISAKLGNGDAYVYGQSVSYGARELENYIKNVTTTCPLTKFVIGGYSQGAQVISKALPNLNSDQIIYAATFGDPKTYLPEGHKYDGKHLNVPIACQGKELSDYRTYVPDCLAYEGILGSYRPYEPAGFEGKVGLWCKDKDIMCSAGIILSDHLSYTSSKLYRHAANIIAKKLVKLFPAETVGDYNISANQDTVILIDSTGSMGFMIYDCKGEAKRLAKETLEKGGHVALVEYRDLSDPFDPVIHCDFSCTYEQFETAVDSLDLDGGGDNRESMLNAMMYAMNNLEWHAGATKSIIALTDNGYLDPDHDGTTAEDVIRRSYEIDPVNLYVITPAVNEFGELTTATGGAIFDYNTGDYSVPTDYLLNRPVASLPLSNYYGAPGDKLTFDASASESITDIDHYEWDLDGNNVFESVTAEPTTTKIYPQEFSGIIQVKVIDKNGLSSNTSANVTISSNLTPASIDNLRVEQQNDTTFIVSFEPSKNTTKTLVIINGVILGYTANTTLTFTDVDQYTTLRLVPISDMDQRGVATETVLGKDKDNFSFDFADNIKIKSPNTGRPIYYLNANGLHIRTYRPTNALFYDRIPLL